MENPFIIGFGLSAGGIKPLIEIFKNINPNLNAIYIIVEHHLNSSQNKLKEILKKHTKLSIKLAEDEETIKPHTIYVCPSNQHITIVNDKIELYTVEENALFKPSINWFFESIAKYSNKAIGIILSGALNDGSNGILNIKLQGGMVIIQDPKTCEFPMMPQNAIETKLYDFILPPKSIAQTINKICSETMQMKDDKIAILTQIFNLLNEEFQVDFNDYKIGTILRRIDRRMVLNKISSLEKYLEYLKTNQKEKKLLFDDLLIVVTSFCRNYDAFISLKDKMKNYILSTKDDIKIWNIGCATGEESYSLAIMIDTILKENNIKRNFHIFSTDISQKAINIARKGSYDIIELQNALPECNLDYFIKKENKYIVKPYLREKVSFAIHNILTDTPLINIDLVVCRNLLIYFKTKSQEKVFSTAHYALNQNGLLFIGKSETLPEYSIELFTKIDNKHKIYKKANTIQKLFPINTHLTQRKKIKINSNSIIESMKENINQIFNTFIIIDTYGNILYTAGEYEKYLKIPKGEFSNNIFSFIDDELNLPLHTIISKTKNELVSINYKIRLKKNTIQYINIISIPLNDFKQNAIGIFFIPSSTAINISEEKKDCIELEHELVETKQKLKYTLEELSTTNEELQTSNEELQSSNEELITTNEELRAVNESLNKTNNELNEYKTKLEHKVEEKTKEILKQQQIRSAIFENTNNLIIILSKNEIIDANKSFLEFFEIDTISKFNFNEFKYKKKFLSIYQLLDLPNSSKIEIKNKIFLIKKSNLDKDIFAINFIDITMEEKYIQTLQKELDKKIKEIRKKDIVLQNEYKLARMGEMLENISHQYRQHLNLLSLTISRLEMNLAELTNQEIIECIEKSYKIINYFSETIDDFKNIFKQNKIKTMLNLKQLIKGAINFIEIQKTIQNINIEINIDENLEIYTYPNDLNHIILNLLHNAKDAFFETNPIKPYIKISAKEKNGFITIKIKDNAGGIKDMKNLFIPYKSTKENGTGIGLYMSKIIAKEKLNGKLWVKNRKNGATFFIRIKNEKNI